MRGSMLRAQKMLITIVEHRKAMRLLFYVLFSSRHLVSRRRMPRTQRASIGGRMRHHSAHQLRKLYLTRRRPCMVAGL